MKPIPPLRRGVCAAAIFGCLRFAWAQSAYTLSDLGTLAGDTDSWSAAINASGQIAGFSAPHDFSSIHGFIYAGGKVTAISALAGTSFTIPAGINASGQVVGASASVNATTGVFSTRGFLSASGRTTDIGDLGRSYTRALAINDAGQIVGESDTANTDTHAFLSTGGKMTDLGTLGGPFSTASGINASGQVVGYADTAGGFFGATHAFLYSNGRMTDLGTLGGADSSANAINDVGQIVGTSAPQSLGSVPDYSNHPFLFSAGKMTDLGTLPGFDSGEAFAINRSGQIVGVAYNTGNEPGYFSSSSHGFLYAAGRMIDLNRLLVGSAGWVILQATAINDAGAIAATAISPQGSFRAVLLTPTPAPAIASGPASQYVPPGTKVTLNLSTVGDGLSYQWKKNGVAIAGATSATFALNSAQASDAGFYFCTVTNTAGSVDSPVGIVTVQVSGTSRLTNVSSRGFLPAGGTLTAGFVLTGTGTKSLVVRGVGPTLGQFGVDGVLADPRLDLIPVNGKTAVQSNEDWGGTGALSTAFANVGAFALPAGSHDAAVFAPFAAGGYSAQISTKTTGGSGVVLAEVYDSTPGTGTATLVNVSTRGFTGTGGSNLIAGFVVSGPAPKQLLVRAVGPGLTSFGVTGTLTRPRLTLYPTGANYAIATNDSWGFAGELSTAFTQVGAFPIASDDAALIVRVPPGGYTAVISGIGGDTGESLIEVYDLDPAPGAAK
jgi:probable HAF family extracellular repeat protein